MEKSSSSGAGSEWGSYVAPDRAKAKQKKDQMEARRLQRQQEAEEELAAIARGDVATIAAVAARDERSAKIRKSEEEKAESRDRLACLRLLRSHKKGEAVVDALANGRLPIELVLRVMEYVVKSKSATIDIRDLERQKLCEIRKSVLGISEASDSLDSIFEEAMVKTALVSLDLSVDPHTISLPLLLLPLSHPIQALEIACVAGISCRNHRYPSQLLRATFVMAEIAGLVPRLASLTLRLTLNDECRHGHFQSTSWSGIVCRSGFTEYKSLRQVIEDLINALRVHLPRSSKTLVAAWKGEHPFICKTNTLAVDDSMTIDQVLKAAFDV